MKQHYAICNVKNSYIRCSLLLLVSPLIAFVALAVTVYTLFAAAWVGLKAAGCEVKYHSGLLTRIISAGVVLAWMGRKAYDEKQNNLQAARVDRMMHRA